MKKILGILVLTLMIFTTASCTKEVPTYIANPDIPELTDDTINEPDFDIEWIDEFADTVYDVFNEVE